ncbi:unnamed protein product [Malus baccata var. baccata]
MTRDIVERLPHNNIVSSLLVVWESWAEILKETKILVRDKLSVNFDFKDISPKVITYLDETFANRYGVIWRLLAYRVAHPSWRTGERIGSGSATILRTQILWYKKSIAGKIARESKTLLHHSGSKPFSYRLEARREEGSKFPEIDLFKDVYVQPGDETSEQLYASMVEKRAVVLQEATSQLPPDTPIEDVTVPEDAGFEIMTKVLNQKFGRCHGKVVRGIGKARVRETAHDEQIKAQNEQMRVQNEQLRAENEQMKAQN